MKIMTSLASMLIISCMLFSMPLVSAEHTTLHVGGTGYGNYTSITSALADVTSGDTIFIHPGIYYETLDIQIANITIRGNSTESVILDAQYAGSVIRITADHTTITSLACVNSTNRFHYAGIEIFSGYNIITHTELTNNYYGIVLQKPTRYNTISYNHIYDNNQCGIYFSGAIYNDVHHNIFANQPANGCGLYDYSNHNTLDSNIYTYNQLCGVNIRDSYHNVVIRNEFINNTIGLHVPPPGFDNLHMDNVYIGGGIEEQQSPVILSTILCVSILIVGFFIASYRLKKRAKSE